LGAVALHQVYAAGAESYSGRVTVPVLWDRQTGRIVSNESAEIVRMFNSAFVDVAEPSTDFYPASVGSEIDEVNARVYRDLNNGVYRAGFARTQQAYEEGFDAVFVALDWLEMRLSDTRFVVGDAMTEADIRLFPTLARFDVAYHSAFKCNLHRLIDYPSIWDYARAFYQQPGVAGTVDFGIYKRGYHSKSELRNPLGIVPKGPGVDWSEPSTRFMS
jgi:putative glutathione S-transferase